MGPVVLHHICSLPNKISALQLHSVPTHKEEKGKSAHSDMTESERTTKRRNIYLHWTKKLWRGFKRGKKQNVFST